MADGMHRVVCVSTDDGFEEYPYVVDIFLSEGRPLKDRYYFGFTGRFGAELWPFVLNRDGQTDFGSGADDAARFGRFNILDKSITVGELVTVTERDMDDNKSTEWIYRIK